MTSDTFIVRQGNKDIAFVRTESGRLFKISNRRIKTNGLIPKAVEESALYVAELYARFGVKPSLKSKALEIKRFRKVVN